MSLNELLNAFLRCLIELIRGLIGQSDDGFRGCGGLDELKVWCVDNAYLYVCVCVCVCVPE